MAAAPDPKLIAVACAVVAAIACTGLLVGFGQPVTTWQPTSRPAVVAPEGVLPAVPYLAMDGKARGPNRGYVSDLNTLVSHPPGILEQVPTDPALRAAAVARRAARRAYSGAPPVIPHPVDANDVASCYQCHGEGKVIDTVVAPRISHQRYTNCTQCHAPVAVGIPGAVGGLEVVNTFAGETSAGTGSRAYAGAPPTIPHPTLMRENCMACHGLLGQNGLRTPHPWRVNCLQCHAPDASLDQRTDADPAPPPWAGETGR